MDFSYDGLIANTKSELVVPLQIASKTIGTLDIHSEKENDFSESDKLTFKSLGNQIAIAIENAHLYDCTREMVVIEERNRLARNLHDSITQSFFSLDLHARAIEKYLDNDLIKAKIQLGHLRQVTHDTLEEMRSLISELRPISIKDIGLINALRAFIEQMNKASGSIITLCLSGNYQIPSEIEESLFRIIQEAIRNAIKHSGGNKIGVEINEAQSRFLISITDNGKGFDQLLPRSRRAFGIISMTERTELLGGELRIVSRLGEGTSVEINIPTGKG